MGKKSKGSRNAFRYPISMRIDETTDYLEIRVKEYQPPGVNTNGSFKQTTSTGNIRNNSKTNFTIQLPIPNGVTDSNSVAWDEDSANALELKGAEAFKDAVKNAKIMDDTVTPEAALESLKGAGKSIMQSAKEFGAALDENTREQILNYFGAKAVGIFGSNMSANSLTSRSSGQVLNPNMELLFKGVQLRTFPFTFTFTPRSRDESLIVKQIINIFKRSMAAKTTTAGSGSRGIFIQAPDIFELRFMRGGRPHPFLYQMKPMALKSMNVNYSDTGAFITYEDSTPVKMSMNLSFTELNPIYYDDYFENGNTLPGTNDGVGY